VNGFQRVQDTLVSVGLERRVRRNAHTDFLDASWNVVYSTTSDVKGTRLETPSTAQVDFLDANLNVVLSTTSEAKGTRLETPGQN
jgi:hypothetical protein